MRHVTMTCPNCNTPDKAVGDPDESKSGWEGTWYCFNCHSSGTYFVEYVVLKAADPEL